MPDDLPEALASLVQGLEDRGFATISDEGGAATFGNRVIEMHSPGSRDGGAVRLVQDRGLWNAEVQLGREWHGVYDVLLALRSAPYETRAESHGERRATTLAVVDALSSSGTSAGEIKSRLDDYRRAYGQQLGVEPSG
jgi:hypothetical protein